jgi:Holliday junction resolvase RusA-like endonuclease
MNRDPIIINGKEWTYDARTRTHRPAEAVDYNNDPGQTSDVERNPSNEPVAKRKATAFDTPVSVRIISYRSRLADPDNISGKAAVDGCVHCGILRDDSAKEIASYRADEQIKVQNETDEKTEIVITEV